jgi:hypothetical protein
MENLKKELQQAIMERFKQEQIANALEKQLAKHTEKIFLEKYKGTKIKRGNLEYELFRVKCFCGTTEYDFKMTEVSTELIYTITSDINKEEMAALVKAKKEWDKDKYMGWYDPKKIKIKLWIEDTYDISIDKIIKNEINLTIDGKIR